MSAPATGPGPLASRRVPLALAVGAGVALAGDLALDPAHRHVPLCPFHAVTGWWCPLCGGLRAGQSLAHLHVRTALHDNVVFVGALPLLLVLWAVWLTRARSPVRASRLLTAGVVLLGVTFTVVRNLPVAQALRPV